MPKWVNTDKLAKIQYHGEAGITQVCLNAIIRLIHFGNRIEEVKLLTRGNYHAFLLSLGDIESDCIAIKSGFSSGYSGQGSRGLSIALQLLQRRVSWIEEYTVSSDILQRIDDSCLLASDLEEINTAKQVTPSLISEYIYNGTHRLIVDNERLLQQQFPSVIPLRLVDLRLMDLAIEFEDNPDSSLLTAYRRLEDTIRKRTNLKNEIIGAKLFSKVFRGDNALLYWEDIEPAEREGRASLFEGTYMAFRNRRAHRELRVSLVEGIREFLLLNELFLLESQAINRSKP